jgi:hypothetical protein
VAAGLAGDLKEGVRLGAEAIDSGQAAATLAKLRDFGAKHGGRGVLWFGAKTWRDAVKICRGDISRKHCMPGMGFGSGSGLWTVKSRAEAQRQTTVSTEDLMIAAHALSLGLTLVTHDQAFSFVDGLRTEDWTVA